MPEIARDELAERSLIAVRIGQLHQPGHRLLAQCFLTEPLPGCAAAYRDQHESAGIQQAQRFLFGRSNYRGEVQRGRHFSGSLSRSFRGDDEDLVRHRSAGENLRPMLPPLERRPADDGVRDRKDREVRRDPECARQKVVSATMLADLFGHQRSGPCRPRMTLMQKRSFDELVQLMHTLRAPGGCPWDREQTLPSLKPFVIEEAYEVVDAIDREHGPDLVEELGDLLLQAVFIAEVTSESGSSDIYDSITAIHDKLVRRHPHVFGQATANNAEEVLVNWEKLKNEERKAENKSVLAGVPPSLPALLRASRLTEKAGRVGFDWRRTDDVFEKIEEEITETKEAIASGDQDHIREEIGDLLFTIANLARKLNVNAEEALQSANRKFTRRFESMESHVRAEGRNLDQLSLEQMDALWDEAKASERP